MVAIELDWAAPIVPGHSVMGLVLGTARREVLKVLAAQPNGDGPDTILLRNSPQLRLEYGDQGSIVLRATRITPVNHPWHNEVARLSFTHDALSNIEVRLPGGAGSYTGVRCSAKLDWVLLLLICSNSVRSSLSTKMSGSTRQPK